MRRIREVCARINSVALLGHPRLAQDLDTGEDFSVDNVATDPKTAIAFADTLLQLLDSLTDPVIPPSLHAKCTQITSRDEAFEVHIFPNLKIRYSRTFDLYLRYSMSSLWSMST